MTQRRRDEPLHFGGEGLPYSKGMMARALTAVGVSPLRAYELALHAEQDLRRRGASAIDLERLHELAVAILGDEDGTRAVSRLRRYRVLRELDMPIVLLVGGTTGTGKSTVATEVAHRLGITRVTSTDFIRQTMRAFFSPEFMPTVHESSFDAGSALPDAEREAGDPLIVGFIDQTRHVLVGVQASIDRALQEGWSCVLEGIHLVPGRVPPQLQGTLVVHVILAIEREEVHAQHFWTRDADSGGMRALDRYLERLGDIRHLQDFLVDEARKAGVPVVQNDGAERAIGAVMELVFDRAEQLQQAGAHA
jgi:2-phosphoglycerate kinase